MIHERKFWSVWKTKTRLVPLRMKMCVAHQEISYTMTSLSTRGKEETYHWISYKSLLLLSFSPYFPFINRSHIFSIKVLVDTKATVKSQHIDSNLHLYEMVFYLLSIFISLLFHSFCKCDIAIGSGVSISVPSTYKSGFEGRAYFIRAGEVVPSFKAALSIEALDGRYLCALVVLFGEMEVWNSRRFSLFFPLELCVLELMESGVLQLRDSSGRIGWRTGTAGQGVEVTFLHAASEFTVLMHWFDSSSL